MQEIITDIKQLTEPSEPLKFITDIGISKDEGLDIIGKLKEVLETREDLIALCAPQIGIRKRIICIKFDSVIKTFINPIIKKKSEGVIRFETNASLPNKEIAICRPTELEIAYHTDEFNCEENKLLGPAAAIFMQQYELLDGIITEENKIAYLSSKGIDNLEIVDIPVIIAGEYSGGGLITEIKEEADHFTTEDVPMIAELLSKQQELFKAIGACLAISTNKVLRPVYNNLKYMDKVCLGEIIPITPTPKDKSAANSKLNKSLQQANLKDFLRRKK